MKLLTFLLSSKILFKFFSMIKLIGELIINHVKKQMLEINTLQILLCFYSALNNKYDNN